MTRGHKRPEGLLYESKRTKITPRSNVSILARRRHSLAQRGSVNLEIISAVIRAHILAWTA